MSRVPVNKIAQTAHILHPDGQTIPPMGAFGGPIVIYARIWTPAEHPFAVVSHNRSCPTDKQTDRKMNGHGQNVGYSSNNSNILARRRPRELTEEQKAEVREAFEIFDMDKDGALDFHEFKVSRDDGGPW